MSEAMREAIDLLHLPSQARGLRAAPLPNGINLLLRVATGDETALESAKQLTGRSAETNRNAAAFFIEQILLRSDDHHRNLGVSEHASPSERRAHMALLLKWLHPDVSNDAHKARLAGRVIAAWSATRAGRQSPHASPARLPRRPNKGASSRRRIGQRRTKDKKEFSGPRMPRPSRLQRLLRFFRSLRHDALRP